MKRITSITIIIALMFTMAACTKKQEEPVTPPTEEPSALQLSMEKLLDADWEATDNGYVYVESTDYCNMEINARPGAEDLDLEIHYDYKDHNDKMAATYSEDNSLAISVTAMWYEKIVGVTQAEIENINYIIYIGDKKVADASITAEEAAAVASENDD